MAKLILFWFHGSGDSCWSSDRCGQCSLSHTQTQKDELLLLFTLPSHIPLAIITSLCPLHINLGLCLPPPIFQLISCNSLCVLHDSSRSWDGIACGQMVAWAMGWSLAHRPYWHRVNSRVEKLTLCKGNPALAGSCLHMLCAEVSQLGTSALWEMVTETPWCRWFTERDW